ncbi:MAG: aminotransferase class I/II-fold pyridoxal phosphate-dependent enzyme [Magnetospirillum sp.]|nr:aminotransferase class I/II-fold pyridoxal phosphate-dependent enzyme [Magnetospirillum sp.]
MQNLDATLSRVLDDLAQSGRKRSLRVMRHLPAGRVIKDGRELLNFSSNDYLGLAQHPLLIERARQWAETYGAGSGASRLVTGHTEAFQRVEEKIAAAKGVEAALVFASGWQLNASVLPALLDRTVWGAEPLVFADRLNHASLIMGCQSAGVKQNRFRHNDLTHLKELLDRTGRLEGPRVIVTESVFSMDGDAPDIDQLVALAEEWDAFLYLDEAHATGVLGANGFGLSVGTHVDLAMGTFSKAMGGFGAYAAVSKTLKDFLVNRASGMIYATALPPAVLGAMDAALDLVPTMAAERARLQDMAARLRGRLNDAGLDTGRSTTQIVPVILGDEERTLKVAAFLEERGFLGIAIRPPTVPMGGSRIRFALSARHSPDDVERLADCVVDAARSIP